MTSHTSDQEALEAAAQLIGPSRPARSTGASRPPGRPDLATDGGGQGARRMVVTAGLVVAAGLAVGAGYGLTRADASSDTQAVGGTAAEVLDGALVGRIEGAAERDEVGAVAWPGQVLTAPEPTAGTAVDWQWQLCERPAEDDDRPLDCTSIDGATDNTYEAPPTDAARPVRVIVTVDLGDAIHVRAASAPVTAQAWPESITPGQPPTTG